MQYQIVILCYCNFRFMLKGQLVQLGVLLQLQCSLALMLLFHLRANIELLTWLMSMISTSLISQVNIRLVFQSLNHLLSYTCTCPSWFEFFSAIEWHVQHFLITADSLQVVDGKLSQTCYLMALDSCYRQFCNKWAAATLFLSFLMWTWFFFQCIRFLLTHYNFWN